MRTTPNISEDEPASSKPANATPPDIASASVPDTLAVLQVNPGSGLTLVKVDIHRKERTDSPGSPTLVRGHSNAGNTPYLWTLKRMSI